MIKKALSLNTDRVPNNLPYPLSKALTYIKVGKLNMTKKSVKDAIEEIEFDTKLTEEYKSFLNDYSFDYLGFDESRLDTAYDNLDMQNLIDEENRKIVAKEQQRIRSQQRKLKDKCSIYYGSDLNIYNACMGRSEYLYEGKYGLIAKYIVQGKCDYVAGSDSTQLSYICKNPRTSSCSVIYDNYSQQVVDACLRCGGTRQWLAEFVASRIKGKFIPTCY